MLLPTISPAEKRKNLRKKLQSNCLLQFPGTWSPLVSMAIEKQEFDGVYISGSVLSNDLGYPDIGLTTLTEVSQRGRQMARVTNLPTIIDIDTGFGGTLNAYRTISEMIEMGLAGCHIEDQQDPKRCGHLDGKTLIPVNDMVHKISSAAAAKKLDENFLLIARTDARSVESLEKAIERAKAYVDAGSDCIFTEALANEKEFELFRKALPKTLLLANMTEFGKSKILDYKTLSNIGYNIVIYPVTLLRIAMQASITGLTEIKKTGSQKSSIANMFTREELYKLTRYQEYNELDQNIYNFNV